MGKASNSLQYQPLGPLSDLFSSYDPIYMQQQYKPLPPFTPAAFVPTSNDDFRKESQGEGERGANGKSWPRFDERTERKPFYWQRPRAGGAAPAEKNALDRQ